MINIAMSANVVKALRKVARDPNTSDADRRLAYQTLRGRLPVPYSSARRTMLTIWQNAGSPGVIHVVDSPPPVRWLLTPLEMMAYMGRKAYERNR
jgi:hypothetical protein